METKTTYEDVMALLGANEEAMEEASKEAKVGRPASPAQVKYYVDLCTQKGQTPNFELEDTISLNAEINKLKAMPYFKPVSDKQIERITELCGVLGLTVPDLSKLNGAYDGSASKFIVQLKEMTKNVVLPATDKQLAMITQMNMCPDFDKIVIAELNSKDASEHIAKHKEAFYGWKKTRLTAKQFALIETLTERSGSKLDYEVIIQFDEATATKYIDQLEMEFADKSMLDTTLEPEDMYAMKTPDDGDARVELRALVARLYASIGQELEEEMYETMDWVGLKELVAFVKMFGVDVAGLLDRVTMFTPSQKEQLLA